MKYGVIVDGYSSGNELVKELLKLGVTCLHVQSSMSVPDMYISSFNQNNYLENYIFKDNIEEVLNKLSMYNIDFVIPGSEPGVEVADIIGQALDVPLKNPLSTSLHRRNKFFMYEQLKNHQLPYIPQFKSSICSELIEWSKDKKFPLVVKPLKSAGGDKVKICYNNDDIISGFKQIVNSKPNALNLLDTEVLIQKYVDAPEIAVNTIQYNGQSYLNEIVQFHKQTISNGRRIYDYATLVPFEHYGQALAEYVFNVAKSLDIRYGAMHAEIFAHQNQFILIEAAARLMGANIPVSFMQECLTHPQSYMMSLLYASPLKFLDMIKQPPKIKKNFRIIFLISPISGKLSYINYLDSIRAMPSFHSINIRAKHRLEVTVDYATSPGLIYLCHENEDVLTADYQTIRQLEAKEMYITKVE